VNTVSLFTEFAEIAVQYAGEYTFEGPINISKFIGAYKIEREYFVQLLRTKNKYVSGGG